MTPLLGRCCLCDEWHFVETEDERDHCIECLRAVHQMRALLESRGGGSLVMVGDRIVVRTGRQMRSRIERALYSIDIARALGES
jgi:hypothetical protein